jgi:hypothetical protein
VFVSTTAIYYPNDNDHKNGLLIAVLYGFDIVFIMIYFIILQLCLIKPSDEKSKFVDILLKYNAFDVCLILNLFLATVSFLLFIIYAICVNNNIQEFSCGINISSLQWLLGGTIKLNVLLSAIIGLGSIVIFLGFLWDCGVKLKSAF